MEELIVYFVFGCVAIFILGFLGYKKEVENTFSASKGGPYKIDEAAKDFYSRGLRDGSSDKRQGYPYHHRDYGTEVVYKNYWTNLFGVPNNDKAQKVYNRLLQDYKEGYDEGYKF